MALLQELEVTEFSAIGPNKSSRMHAYMLNHLLKAAAAAASCQQLFGSKGLEGVHLFNLTRLVSRNVRQQVLHDVITRKVRQQALQAEVQLRRRWSRI